MGYSTVDLGNKFEVSDNDDAVYACGATINVESNKITENTGRYVLGYTNNRENNINFKDGANISKNYLQDGETKDYTIYLTNPGQTEETPSEPIKTYTTLITGQDFNHSIKTLAAGSSIGYDTNDTNIRRIVWTKEWPTSDTPARRVSESGYVDSNITINSSTTIDDNEVYAWYKSNTIYLYSKANLVYLSGLSDHLFHKLISVTSIQMDRFRFNTSIPTTAEYMFNQCEQLTSLDLTGFDTRNVGHMGGMFRRCYNLVNSKQILANMKTYFKEYYTTKLDIRKTFDDIKKLENDGFDNIKELYIENNIIKVLLQATQPIKNLLFLFRNDYNYITKLVSLIEEQDKDEQIDSLAQLFCNQFYDNILIPNPEQEELLILIYKLFDEEIRSMNSALIDDFLNESSFMGKFCTSYMNKQEFKVYLSMLVNPLILSIQNEDEECLNMSLISIRDFIKTKIKEKKISKMIKIMMLIWMIYYLRRYLRPN